MNRQYTPEERQRFEAVAKQVGPEEIKAIEEGWTALFAESRANPDLDPATPEAQALLDRYDALFERTRRGWPEDLWSQVGENYDADAFEGDERAPQSSDFAFFERIRQARAK